jgi:aryl sulfotransferase
MTKDIEDRPTEAVLDDQTDRPPVPWSDPGIQSAIQWRDGDIVVSVPVKSGTTWTMNIVHQLRSGGDPHLADVYVEVPWLELLPAPTVTREEMVARFDGMPSHRRRAFKTHSAPGPLPYQRPGVDRDVKYVVVVRHPDEAIASLHPFIGAHSKAWFELWSVPRDELIRPDFERFFTEVAKPLVGDMIFAFVDAWWPLRNEPNVLFMHYSDMKRDHEGSVRKIGRFLDLQPEPEQWPTILECTSFPWMKANEEKFEIRTVTEVPILEQGAMVRKGRTGSAKDDGVTPAISAEISKLGRAVLSDETAFEWCYRGGPLTG